MRHRASPARAADARPLMTLEVREIPPAPRVVHWTAAMRHRWPLGCLGLLLAVYGGLGALLLFHASGGKRRDDLLLDRGPVGRATARIDRVDAPEVTIRGQPVERFFYTFATGPGQPELGGSAFGRAGMYAMGGEGIVEYLPDRPEKNRLQGTRIFPRGDLISPAPLLALVVLPGLTLLALWGAGVLRQRRMLARGDVAVAVITSALRLRWVIPTTVRVEYRFRDHRARWCAGSHWVRARSWLGHRLATSGELALVHERAHPEHSRLVTARDFAAGPPRRQRESETAQPV